MCSFGFAPIDLEYVRDHLRDRDWRRFERIRNYAYRRWEASRDLRHSKQWLQIIASVDRRNR
jgi:hypothetical protein